MSSAPALVFLHGVGQGDPEDKWLQAISVKLESLGYPPLDDVNTIAPKYANALRGADDSLTVPPITVASPHRSAAPGNRRDFERRTAAMELRLGRHERGTPAPAGRALIHAAVAVPAFQQARNYVQSETIRAQVLTRVLSKLPSSGRIVIIAHSLGSVIAADLLRRLPRELEVVALITIGSPLASGAFAVNNLREALVDPPTNLGWWLNVWNRADPVTGQRGVSSAFPWMLDIPIDTGVSVSAHSAVTYLASDVIGDAVGFSLFGSRSKELERLPGDVDVHPDDTETLALMALRFNALIAGRLDPEPGARFTGAAARVQAMTVDAAMRRRNAEKRLTPLAIARLAWDTADPHAAIPETERMFHIAHAQAHEWLTLLAVSPLVAPFEISVNDRVRREAMKDLCTEAGLSSQLSSDVFESLSEARKALSAKKPNWVKLGAIGAGAVAVAAATGGLALVAGAGLSGAAAITSALAAFGPGGMIGGLATAGSLIGVGTGSIAYGLTSSSVSAADVESKVLIELALALLRDKQGFEQNPETWLELTELESLLRREHERADEFSDRGAPGIQEIARKLHTVETALAHLSKIGLAPAAMIVPDSQASDARDNG